MDVSKGESMAIKDNFLSEIKIGTNVELMIGSKEISGRIISLDVDTVKLEKMAA